VASKLRANSPFASYERTLESMSYCGRRSNRFAKKWVRNDEPLKRLIPEDLPPMSTLIESYEVPQGIDLRLTLDRLWSRRRWIAASGVVGMLVLGAIGFLMTPIYRSTTVMIPASSERQGFNSAIAGAVGSLGLASLAGLNVGTNTAETEEALAVLKSRQFTETFIREKQLLPKLFENQWDPQKGTWRSGIDPPTFGKAYKFFDGSVRTVLQDKKTGLVTLQIDWKDRVEAADWANDIVQRLNLEMRTRAASKSDALLGYLEKEVATTSVVATREAINRLIEAQVKQRMLANVTQEFVFRVVDVALPPDKNDRLRPHKFLMMLTGIALGAALAIVCVLVLDWWRGAMPAKQL
jgi:uncharacterized protein involved in exopolysaccharide biosynthesis